MRCLQLLLWIASEFMPIVLLLLPCWTVVFNLGCSASICSQCLVTEVLDHSLALHPRLTAVHDSSLTSFSILSSSFPLWRGMVLNCSTPKSLGLISYYLAMLLEVKSYLSNSPHLNLYVLCLWIKASKLWMTPNCCVSGVHEVQSLFNHEE